MKKAGETIGLAAIGEVLQANVLEKQREVKKLNAMVSWDYYANWRWRREKKKRD